MHTLTQPDETGRRTLIDSATGEIIGTIRKVGRGRYAYALPSWQDTEIVVHGSLAYARKYLEDVARPVAAWL